MFISVHIIAVFLFLQVMLNYHFFKPQSTISTNTEFIYTHSLAYGANRNNLKPRMLNSHLFTHTQSGVRYDMIFSFIYDAPKRIIIKLDSTMRKLFRKCNLFKHVYRNICCSIYKYT